MFFSILVTPPGMIMFVSPEHSKKAPSPIFVKLSGITMLLIFLQSLNAQSLMVVTLSGMVTISSFPKYSNSVLFIITRPFSSARSLQS